MATRSSSSVATIAKKTWGCKSSAIELHEAALKEYISFAKECGATVPYTGEDKNGLTSNNASKARGGGDDSLTPCRPGYSKSPRTINRPQGARAILCFKGVPGLEAAIETPTPSCSLERSEEESDESSLVSGKVQVACDEGSCLDPGGPFNVSNIWEWTAASGPNSVGFKGRVSGFSGTFLGGMNRDSTLYAASRETCLKSSEHQRKRALMLQQLERHRDFHDRMLGEIGRVTQREERAKRRKHKRLEARRIEREQREFAAARRIQTCQRGRSARRRYALLRAREYQRPCLFLPSGAPKNLLFRRPSFSNLFETRATRIASIARTFLCRHALHDKISAATALQSRFRCYQMHKRWLCLKRGVILLGSLCRGRIVRRALAIDEESLAAEINKELAEKKANSKSKHCSLRSGKGRGWKLSTESNYNRKQVKHSPLSGGKRRKGSNAPGHSSSKRRGAKLGENIGADENDEKTTTLNNHTSLIGDGVKASLVSSGLLAARENKVARRRAALNLQKTFRGFKTRKSMSKPDLLEVRQRHSIRAAERKKQDEASRAIQKHFRKHHENSVEKREQERASRAIQKHFRKQHEKRQELRVTAASQTIQRQFRASVARKRRTSTEVAGTNTNTNDGPSGSVVQCKDGGSNADSGLGAKSPGKPDEKKTEQEEEEDVYSMDEFED